MKTIILDKPSGYDIVIVSVARGWMNEMLAGLWRKRVTAEEYEKIEKDPLLDYAGYGVEKVLLVKIERWPLYTIGGYVIKNTSSDREPLFVLDPEVKDSENLKTRVMKEYEGLKEAYFEGCISPQFIS
ncbi:MAG: hypothetical protein QXU18_12285 [Thermoplasmatales archaeon]